MQNALLNVLRFFIRCLIYPFAFLFLLAVGTAITAVVGVVYIVMFAFPDNRTEKEKWRDGYGIY